MKRKVIAQSLSVLLLAAGCARAPYVIKSHPAPLTEARKFSLLDKDLYKMLTLSSAQTSPAAGGRMDLVFRVQNRKKETIWGDVKVKWLDHQALTVEETNWQPVQFLRLQEKDLKYSSVRPGVSDYRVLMRLQRRFKK